MKAACCSGCCAAFLNLYSVPLCDICCTLSASAAALIAVSACLPAARVCPTCLLCLLGTPPASTAHLCVRPAAACRKSASCLCTARWMWLNRLTTAPNSQECIPTPGTPQGPTSNAALSVFPYITHCCPCCCLLATAGPGVVAQRAAPAASNSGPLRVPLVHAAHFAAACCLPLLQGSLRQHVQRAGLDDPTVCWFLNRRRVECVLPGAFNACICCLAAWWPCPQGSTSFSFGLHECVRLVPPFTLSCAPRLALSWLAAEGPGRGAAGRQRGL